MAIQVTCTTCNSAFKTDESAAGKRTKCPNCGGPIQIPYPEAEVADESAPAPFSDDELAADQPPAAEEESGGDRRPCPMCGEMILKDAVKCRYCGEIFDPLLKKQAKKEARKTEEGADLTTGDWVVAILCSGIGCIAGIVWMIQGKPKGLKMVGVSIAAAVCWNILSAIVQMAAQ